MGTKKWLTSIFDRKARDPGPPPRPRPETRKLVKDAVKDAVYGPSEEGPGCGKIKIFSIGGAVHVNFGKSYLLKNQRTIEVRDPITRTLRRIQRREDGVGKITLYYRDGRLYDGMA